MMDVKDIKKILDAVAAAEITEFVYETGDYKLTVKRGGEVVPLQAVTMAQPQPASTAPVAVPAGTEVAGSAGGAAAQAPAPAAETAEAEKSHLVEVTAPIVGTFYAAPAPDAEPYVRVGDRVEPGTVLCIIEAMKLMNEIEAEVAGTIEEILVRNEEPVEYGQVLFRINPA